MYVDIGRSLSTGYFLIADPLTREELSYLQRTRDLSTTRCCRSSTALGAGGCHPVAASVRWLTAQRASRGAVPAHNVPGGRASSLVRCRALGRWWV